MSLTAMGGVIHGEGMDVDRKEEGGTEPPDWVEGCVHASVFKFQEINLYDAVAVID